MVPGGGTFKDTITTGDGRTRDQGHEDAVIGPFLTVTSRSRRGGSALLYY